MASGEEAPNDSRPLHVQGDELRALVAASLKHGVPPVDLTAMRLALPELDVMPLEIARRHKALALLSRESSLFVAMADPSDSKAREELEFVCGRKLIAFVADRERLEGVIDRAYEARSRGDVEFDGDNVRAGTAAPSPPLAAARVASLSKTLTGTLPNLLAESASSSRPVRAEGRSVPLPPTVPAFAPSTRGGPWSVWVAGSSPSLGAAVEALNFLGCAVQVLAAPKVLRAALEGGAPDVVFVEAGASGLVAADVLEALRGASTTQPVPVLVLTATEPSWRVVRDLVSAYGARGAVSVLAPPAAFSSRLAAVLDPEGPEGPLAPLPHGAEEALEASTQAYGAGDLPGAIAALERGIAEAPNAFRLHYQVALLHGRTGVADAAIACLERSVALFDGFFPALKNLAVLCERAGFRWRAVDAWERASLVAPDAATRAQIKEHLQSLL